MTKKDILAVLFFLLVVGGGFLLIGRIDGGAGEAETEMVKNAVRNAALTCYAAEGAFPEDVLYLRRHYGLKYNEDKYIVVYDAFASNLLPEIRVLRIGERE